MAMSLEAPLADFLQGAPETRLRTAYEALGQESFLALVEALNKADVKLSRTLCDMDPEVCFHSLLHYASLMFRALYLAGLTSAPYCRATCLLEKGYTPCEGC